MAEFQNAVNSLLGTAAAAAFAANKTIGEDLDVETDANVKFSNEYLQEKQAEQTQKLETVIDKAVVNKNLAEKEFLNPSESNSLGLPERTKNMLQANKDLEMARKAQETLQQKQNLQTALREATNNQISKLQLRRGLLGKVKANKLSWEEL